MVMMIVGVLMCLLAITQLSQYNQRYSVALSMVEYTGLRTTEQDQLQQ